MGTQHCVNLLEHINYQLVYKALTTKSAFPQKERGPRGRMSMWLWESHGPASNLGVLVSSCGTSVSLTLSRDNDASFPNFVLEVKDMTNKRKEDTILHTSYKGITNHVLYSPSPWQTLLVSLHICYFCYVCANYIFICFHFDVCHCIMYISKYVHL